MPLTSSTTWLISTTTKLFKWPSCQLNNVLTWDSVSVVSQILLIHCQQSNTLQLNQSVTKMDTSTTMKQSVNTHVGVKMTHVQTNWQNGWLKLTLLVFVATNSTKMQKLQFHFLQSLLTLLTLNKLVTLQFTKGYTSTKMVQWTCLNWNSSHQVLTHLTKLKVDGCKTWTHLQALTSVMQLTVSHLLLKYRLVPLVRLTTNKLTTS